MNRGTWLRRIVSGYTLEAFRTLMGEGVSIDGRGDLGLMSVVARDRFAYWTEDELLAIFGFLQNLPTRSAR